MLHQLLERLQQDPEHWEEIRSSFREQKMAPKTLLLKEGSIAEKLYFIKKGCLRIWFNNDGKDVTLQFFMEGQAVSSLESFTSGKPSQFNIESIEPTTVVVIGKTDFDRLFIHYPDLKDGFQHILFQRMGHYANLFLSQIKDNPRKRYEDLLKDHPEIVQRIPQHYIASYLGITPISLSRIRNKR